MEKEKHYHIKMFIALFILAIAVSCTLSITAAAAGAVNSDIDEFNRLGGSAEYIDDVDRYYLDVNTENVGIFDTILLFIFNGMANFCFTIVKYVGLVTVVLFYRCMTFDIAEMFRDQITAIQQTLHNGIFEPMFILGFCGSAVIVLKNMWRRDLMGSFGQLIKVVGIVVLSVLLVRDSATVLSMATAITKEISTQALVGMQGGTVVNTSSYAAQSAAVLWENLVHEPWVYLEFGDSGVDEDMVFALLSVDPDSEERNALVMGYSGNAFEPVFSRMIQRLGFAFVYIFPFIVKCAIYIFMALISLFCQLIGIFYILLAPVVLLLTMVPSYEGLISAWLRKMLESQLSILIMSFLIGLLVKFDNMLYEAFAVSWGFLVVLVVQIVVEAMVVYKRDELLGTLSNLQKRVTPGYARSMMLRGADDFQLADRGIEVGAKVGGKIIRKGVELYTNWYNDAEYSHRTGNSTVERPVMDTKTQSVEHSMPSTPSEDVQKPQIQVVRPQMYQKDSDNKIVEFEAYKSRHPVVDGGYRQYEADILRQEQTNTVQRPQTSFATDEAME